MFKTKYFFVALTLLSIFIFSCKEEVQQSGPLPLNIEVDSSKIGPLYYDSSYAISFHPPFLWEKLKTELSNRVESVRKVNKTREKSFTFAPKYVFYNYNSNSILSVGEVSKIDSSEMDDNSLEDYLAMTSSKYDSTKIFSQTYIKDNNLIYHKKLDMSNMVSYKYFLRNSEGKLIQFDYSIRKTNESSEIPQINSSLGTIKIKN